MVEAVSVNNSCHIYILVGDSGGQKYFEETLRSILGGSVIVSKITVVVLAACKKEVARTVDELCGTRKFVELLLSCPNNSLIKSAVCHALKDEKESDVLVVIPGVIVPKGWDIRLRKIAYDDKNIGTVSPLTNDGSLFDLFKQQNHAKFENESTCIDSLFFSQSNKSYVEVPCFLSKCFYLKKNALRIIGGQVKKKDSMRSIDFVELTTLLSNNGFLHVLCDHVYVDLKAGSFSWINGRLPENGAVEKVASISPLVPLGLAVADLLTKNTCKENSHSQDKRPVQLHIMHGWGGGLEHWVGDYCSQDSIRTNIILKSVGTWGAFGSRMELYLDLSDPDPTEVWELALPIHGTSISHLQYKEMLREIIDQYQVDAIMVSSFIGHSLDILDIEKSIVIIAHDYYPFCLAIILVHDTLCLSCEFEKLKKCIEENEHHRFFLGIDAEMWTLLREAYLSKVMKENVTIVVPSPSVKSNLERVDARFKKASFKVIPHGNASQKNRIASEFLQGEVSQKSRLKIIVLGSLGKHKGGLLLRECHEELTQFADLFLVGNGEEGLWFKGKKGVEVIPSYVTTELPEIFSRIKPDLGLLLSICPETFSYTLSEYFDMQTPVIVTRMGSFLDRIQDEVNGFFVDVNRESLISKIKYISNNRHLISKVRENLLLYEHKTLHEMVKEYHQVVEVSTEKLYSYRISRPYGALRSGLQKGTCHTQTADFPRDIRTAHQYMVANISISSLFGAWQKKTLIFLTSLLFLSLTRAYSVLSNLKRVRGPRSGT